jgi:hypothetical protein
MRMGAAPLALALAACTPQVMADRVGEGAARSVVLNVVTNQYPRPEADQAADCVIANASVAEVQALARDVGTRAGTGTLANIAAIAARPATQSCVAGRGLAPVVVP